MRCTLNVEFGINFWIISHFYLVKWRSAWYRGLGFRGGCSVACDCRKQEWFLYLNLSKWRTVPSLSTWKFWKIRHVFDPDGQLDSIAPARSNPTARRGRKHVEFFKIFMSKVTGLSAISMGSGIATDRQAQIETYASIISGLAPRRLRINIISAPAWNTVSCNVNGYLLPMQLTMVGVVENPIPDHQLLGPLDSNENSTSSVSSIKEKLEN